MLLLNPPSAPLLHQSSVAEDILPPGTYLSMSELRLRCEEITPSGPLWICSPREMLICSFHPSQRTEDDVPVPEVRDWANFGIWLVPNVSYQAELF